MWPLTGRRTLERAAPVVELVCHFRLVQGRHDVSILSNRSACSLHPDDANSARVRNRLESFVM